eukprot:UN10279
MSKCPNATHLLSGKAKMISTQHDSKNSTCVHSVGPLCCNELHQGCSIFRNRRKLAQKLIGRGRMCVF